MKTQLVTTPFQRAIGTESLSKIDDRSEGRSQQASQHGLGIFLLVFSIMVVVLDSSNFLAIGLAFFVLMGGLMLVMIGAVGGIDKKKDPDQTRTEVVREVVKVRCKYCNALNFETSQRWSNCGGQL